MLLYEVVALEVPYRNDEVPEEMCAHVLSLLPTLLNPPLFPFFSYNKIIKGILPSLPAELDPHTQRLIVPLMHRCLLPDPSARPSARELASLLQGNSEKEREQVVEANAPVTVLPAMTYPRSVAVIVSISQYASRDLPPLPYAAADAEAVEIELRQRNFEVIVLAEERATKEGLEELLGETLKWRLGEDDRVVLFFAGHIEGTRVQFMFTQL